MKLYLYNCEDNPIEAHKTLTDEIEKDINILEATSSKNPEVTISSASYPSSNYAYIPDFNRYYFIRDRIPLRKGQWKLILDKDILFSKVNELENNVGIMDRQEFRYNLYQEDPYIGTYQDTWDSAIYIGSASDAFGVYDNNDTENFIIIAN